MLTNGKVSGAKTEAKLLSEAKRIEKEKEKAARQAQAAVAKGMKKENWMAYMLVLIDQTLEADKGGTELLTTLELEGLKCETVTQPLPNTISFVRTMLSSDEGEIVSEKVYEQEVLVVEKADVIAQYILDNEILTYANRCRSILSEQVISTVTFIIMGFGKLSKSKRKGTIDRIKWEEGLLLLQYEYNTSCYLVETIGQLTEQVRMFCKALGERPHKLKQHKELFIGAHKENLTVDKDGKGLLQVWIAQLQEIRSVNESIASAVAHQYPSPSILCSYLDTCERDTAVRDIADIPVRRGVGALANIRRVGPESAKRIVQHFTSLDPDEKIS